MYQKRYLVGIDNRTSWFNMTKEFVIKNFQDRNMNPNKMIEILKSGEIITIGDTQWRYVK